MCGMGVKCVCVWRGCKVGVWKGCNWGVGVWRGV